jgi:hypothetical protein
MATLRPVLCLLLLAACAPPEARPGPGPAQQPDQPPKVTPVDPGALPKSAYNPSRDGFVVHEWGTLTSVRGSDGTVLPGLHHEEEDLPAFVADRLSQARADPSLAVDPVMRLKMETPVTYFYSAEPRTVSARVDFPQGLLTQWYPYVREMHPPVFTLEGRLVDRYAQSLDTIPDRCQRFFAGDPPGSMLDWGQVRIEARDQSVALPGPLGRTTWGFARNTAANPIRVGSAAGGQHEKFLFYRGLGNYDLPLGVRFAGDAPTFENRDRAAPLSGLFLMVVTPERAGFAELGDLPPGQTLTATLPEARLDHAAFVRALKARLAARLTEDGLYSDEAVAMVDTWERAYFLTPGVRLLYLLPQVHTDRIIPLQLQPRPDRLVRTMVIRTELLPPAFELELVRWLGQLGDAAQQAAARARFLQQGRFAEPLLTRALALAPASPGRAAGEVLLKEIRGQRRWAPLFAE